MNTAPKAPDKLIVTLKNNLITLIWNKGSDFETAQNGLTYNIYLYNLTKNNFSLSPMADTANGFRRIVKVGNVNHDTIWKLNNIPFGEYMCGVQTIDASYVGSEFIKSKFNWGIIGDSDICSGEISQYYTTIGLKSYSWEVSGGTIISGTDSSIVQINWNSPGSQNIKLISDAGEFNFKVNVIDNSKPKLLYKNSIITNNKGIQFQWFCNGNLIPDSLGGKMDSLKPRSIGYYYVVVNNGVNCYSHSDSIFIDSIPNNICLTNKSNQISLFPNPTRNTIYIKSCQMLSQPEITIYDCSGRKVLISNKFDSNISQLNIDVSTLNGGIYIFILRDRVNIMIKKIVIE